VATQDQLIIPKVEAVEIGPWLGSMRSVPSNQVPLTHLASPTETPALDFLYLPGVGDTGTWKRRGGQTVQFDTLSGGASVTGLLPATWSARCRQIEEFLSDSVTDGIPTICALLSKETMASGLDDGAFANFWWRDRVNSLNRTLCDDYDTTLTYPAPGTIQYYRVIPLWYDSGDGGLTRGTTEYLRRFLLSGARRFQKSGRWFYFPNFRGTPCRDDGLRSFSGTTNLTMASDINSGGHGSGDISGVTTAGTVTGWSGYAGAGAGTNLGQPVYPWVTSIDDDTSYIGNSTASGAGNPQAFNLSGLAPTGLGTWTITYRHRWLTDPGGTRNVHFRLVLSNGKYYDSGNINVGGTGTSWTTATTTIDTSGAGTTAGTANSLEVFGPNVANYWLITYLTVSNGSGTAVAHHLIPSGPFPPTHCGTVAGSSAVTAVTMYPTGDNSTGSWVTAPLYASVDDDSDSDRISSNGSNTRCILDFDTPGYIPTSAAGDTVTLRYRMTNFVASGSNLITAEVRMGSTIVTSQQTIFSSSPSAPGAYSLVLTDANLDTMNSIDGTWATLRVGFVTGSESGLDRAYVSSVKYEILPGAASSEGGWKGKDRFLRAFYYRFEDGSIWALTTPRFPNSALSNGLDMVTVDSANPTVAYASITHNNIPIGPAGVVKVGICRTIKIDSTVDDNLVLNPKDFRLIAEVDNGTTSYVDYAGDDLSLGLDVTGLFIRYNHMMPPASRYLAAGDMRAASAYGKTNPTAIVIAPVGRTADYDLNLAETSSSLYAQDSSYMRLALDSSGVMTLTLLNDTGSATTSNTYTSTNYATLQALVDVINNTSCAVDGMQWRAQILPDVSPDAAMTSLCPHTRDIASVTTTNGSANITKAAGGLGKVALGAFVTGTGITAGTYVDRIDSDTQLHLSANATASGTVTLTFYFRLGDDPTSLSNTGYQRVLGNCLPGFLYFTKTYLNTFPIEKATTWMTVATPGSVKSAPNAWANAEANRFEPPLESGIAMGVAAVDHGFVVPYANKTGAIRPRGPDLVQDRDYSLVIINEDHGCCAWNTVSVGNRFATFLSTSGLCAADLRQIIRFSEDIYAPPQSGVGVVGTLLGTGDFGYEIAASVAATSQDNDSSYASVRVIHSIVWVCYRASSSSSTAANRMLAYDFSAGHETNGLKALSRDNGSRWGWSLPLSRTVSVVGFGRRDDGGHLYGWNDANAGTGAGRIDELETGDTDNSTAISTGTASIPWIKADEGEDIVVHRVILEHNSPSGSTGSLVWHRGYSNDAYTLTPGTSSLDLLSELIHNTTPARTPCTAGHYEYKQASGTAREWRKIKVFIERRKRMR